MNKHFEINMILFITVCVSTRGFTSNCLEKFVLFKAYLVLQASHIYYALKQSMEIDFL